MSFSNFEEMHSASSM